MYKKIEKQQFSLLGEGCGLSTRFFLVLFCSDINWIIDTHLYWNSSVNILGVLCVCVCVWYLSFFPTFLFSHLLFLSTFINSYARFHHRKSNFQSTHNIMIIWLCSNININTCYFLCVNILCYLISCAPSLLSILNVSIAIAMKVITF